MSDPKFGPAGSCERSAAEKIKSTEKLIEWLAAQGLTAFEYQCGRGVMVKEPKGRILGEKAKECGIKLSIHAPYFISLASPEEEKRLNSIQYIFQSAQAADWMGADRIVVHPGGLGKKSREEATALAKETLTAARKFLDEQGLEKIHICPEVMGKINQLGDLSEVLEFCTVDERMIPCVDFGHLNSRMQGTMDYGRALDEIENRLGADRLRNMHIHFSKIEYTSGGEKRHLTFADEIYGPDFEPLIDQFLKRGMSPTVICESAGTQTDDAITMMKYFQNARLHFAL
ncbi:MAG: TIM barrel protein [Clostridia bacterium]|nr:TIM barrel protein [Clostridia bacterium]